MVEKTKKDTRLVIQLILLGIGLIFYVPGVLYYCWNSFFVSAFELPYVSYYMIFAITLLYNFINMRVSGSDNITIKNKIDAMYSKYLGGIICITLFYFI